MICLTWKPSSEPWRSTGCSRWYGDLTFLMLLQPTQSTLRTHSLHGSNLLDRASKLIPLDLVTFAIMYSYHNLLLVAISTYDCQSQLKHTSTYSFHSVIQSYHECIYSCGFLGEEATTEKYHICF